ncbi:hypothetical protein KO501_16570 [Alteromonas sp. C1M14]|nr:hypothetical protein [Alteromonas sp. C1M14]
MCLAESSFSWHGFIAQGVNQSIGSDFISEDDEISFDLTEIGLNMRYDINSSLAVVGQGVYLNGGNRYERGARLDYLFVDWHLPKLGHWDTHMHLGRFKSPHWLYSATRDVPQTRSTIVLPQSVYFDNFRDAALGSDGVLIQLSRPSEQGNLRLNWSYGNAPMSNYQTKALLGEFAQGKLEQDFVQQVSVYWQPPSLNWQVGASWLDSDFTYNAVTDDFLVDGGRSVQFYTLSAVYYSENWEFTTEFQRNTKQDYGGFSPSYFLEEHGEGGYGQFRYMFNNNVSVLVGYDYFVADRNDRDGKKLEERSQGVIPAYFGYMKTTTVGVQWEPLPQWRVQAEYHWVNGAGRLTSVPSPGNTPFTEEYWQMWAIQAMYRF